MTLSSVIIRGLALAMSVQAVAIQTNALQTSALQAQAQPAPSQSTPSQIVPSAPMESDRGTALERPEGLDPLAYEDTTRLEGYLDGLVAAAMREHGIVGASVSVVRGDDMLLLKGYGLADRETAVPVDPARHLFRIGSISKTFTFTALMQLVEDGLVDLDADVNTYLTAFKIPDAFGAPVRIRDLFTHRPGFEEVYKDLFVETADAFYPLEDWLAATAPARVFPAGQVTSYSNWGAALAGYIVQTVSGTRYETYLRDRVLAPLGMGTTTAGQPLGDGHPQTMPPHLVNDLATVYSWRDGYYRKHSFEYIVGAPAGSLSSTASDMARYMRAHLSGGTLDGVRILDRATAERMRVRPYPGRPSADYALGFRTATIAGYPTLEHGGATLTSYAAMIMVPDLGLGVFMAVNGAASALAPQKTASLLIAEMIADMTGGASIQKPAALPMTAADAVPFSGTYMTTRRSYTGLAKLFAMPTGAATVAPSPGGGLLVAGADGVTDYVRTGPTAFRARDGHSVISFELDDTGRAIRYYGDYGHVAMDRMPSDANPQTFYLAIALAGLFAVTQLIAAWKRRAGGTPASPWAARLSWGSVLTAGLVLTVLLLLMVATAEATALGRAVIFSWPTQGIVLLLYAALLLVACTAALVVGLIPAITMAHLTIWRQVHYVLFVTALVYLLIQFNNWNMIGFKF